MSEADLIVTFDNGNIWRYRWCDSHLGSRGYARVLDDGSLYLVVARSRAELSNQWVVSIEAAS